MLSVSASFGDSMDIVVLFDMSRSESLVNFEETRDYISGEFLREFVRKGDTFHLITFGETPRLEISRRIESEGDYRTIIGRLLLISPLAQSSSIENAAEYAETFISELPSARNKKAVFFTAKDGYSAAELGARFNGRTQTYLASLPMTFGTLSSGRTITPPIDAVSPSAPVHETVVSAKPDTPPVEISIPEVSILPQEPSPAVLPLPDNEYEPVLYDKFEIARVILPLSFVLLLGILIFVGILVWKKTARTGVYARKESWLYPSNKNDVNEIDSLVVERILFSRGLLQKAIKINSQYVCSKS
jgi:hypothetical protein